MSSLGKINDNLVFLNLEGKSYIEKAVDDAIDRGCDCLLCMDDAVCAQAMRQLREKHIKVPQQVKVASFTTVQCWKIMCHPLHRFHLIQRSLEQEPARICLDR